MQQFTIGNIMKRILLVITFSYCFLISFGNLKSQVSASTFVNSTSAGTTTWLKQPFTTSFNVNRDYLNGVRLILEPKIGYFNPDPSNPISEFKFADGATIGLETNLFTNIIAFQLFVSAGSTIEFNEKATVVTSGALNGGKVIKGRLGYGLGASLLNGLVAIGYYNVGLNTTDFFVGAPNAISSLGGVYLHIQAVTTLTNITN
ncbi:MAG: hypothetical protein U0264_11755 [Candidatus Kapaibacterium sp.]